MNGVGVGSDREPCSIEGCQKSVYVRGWCTTHYQRWRAHGDPLASRKVPPLPPRCSLEGCSGAARLKGWCLEHFRRWEKTGDPMPGRLWRIPSSATCSEDACDKPVSAKGKCSYHYGKHHRDTSPLCAVEGCPNPRAAASHGLCQKHLYRKRRYGDPLVVQQVQGRDVKERLMELIDQRAPDECWPWTGAVSKRGYAYTRGTEGRGSHALAHRLVYETFVGPIPDGLTIDHLCHRAEECKGGFGCPHRRCCNPSHLAPEDSVANTMRGNAPSAINARKTHCQNGHEFNAVNTAVSRKGKRSCRPCRAAWKQRRRAAGLSA